MGLDIPNLDDKNFDELVAEARSLIARYCPRWTDHNVHDPGITFIELFAWLAEMQIYQLNQVTDGHYEKFFKLAGFSPFAAQPARVDITFENKKEKIIEKGTKIFTKLGKEKIMFETEEDLAIIRVNIKSIFTRDGSEIIDNTKANGAEEDDIYFAVFGRKFTEGSELQMVFDNPLPRKEFQIAFFLYEKDLKIKRIPSDKNVQIAPSVNLAWEYLSEKEWKSFYIKEDTTFSLTRSGRISLDWPSDVQNNEVKKIRCYVKKGRYEIAPMINWIRLNTVSAVQIETINENLGTGNDEPEQAVRLKKNPVIRREQTKLIIQVQDKNNKWENWKRVDDFDSSGPDDPHYVFNQEEKIITFGSGLKGRIPIESKRIRATYKAYSCTQMESIKIEELSRGCGIPGQIIRLKKTPVIRKKQENLIIQVKSKDGKWEDWKEVDNFESSGPVDPHYMFHKEERIITFGNGLNGRVPPESNGIRATYKATLGPKGNVPKKQEFWIQKGGCEGIRGENLKEATGGKASESQKEARERVKKDFRTLHRAITSKDYEKLVCATPGLRVARSKILPNYNPDYPCITFPGAVTAVVVPYAREGTARPFPGNEFRRTILDYLNRLRLITTDVHVIGPEYVKISIKCKINIEKKSSQSEAKKRVHDALKKFINPLRGGPEEQGWPFGRSVYVSEIYQTIDKVPGVDYVTDVSIDAEGQYRKTKNAVEIPPNALVFSDDHQVEFL